MFWEDLCFDAQQAAEKALKAVLLAAGIQFRFVHDIAELLSRLEAGGIELPQQVRSAAALTDYAVEARYPGPSEAVSEDEYAEALSMAESVVMWAETQVRSRGDRGASGCK